MYLDTVSTIDETSTQTSCTPPVRPVWTDWTHFPYTSFLHHGSRCCAAALAWLTGMDRSRLYGESPYAGPRWLRSIYEWGPMQHPAHWCEALRLKVLDCGGQAAVAREVFLARGLETLPLQIVQQYNQDDVAHWRCSWEEKESDTHWMNGVWIYHEGCAVVLPDGALKLWDATSSCWLDPQRRTGYSSIAALKISSHTHKGPILRKWGPHLVPQNEWLTLPEE